MTAKCLMRNKSISENYYRRFLQYLNTALSNYQSKYPQYFILKFSEAFLHLKKQKSLCLSPELAASQNNQLLLILLTIVCFMSYCKQIFGDIIFTFAQSSSNSPRSFQHFRRTLKRNFNLIRQQMKNFPIYPHCKNCQHPATL